MKKLLASALLGCMLSASALADTVSLNIDPGFFGGVWGDYTLVGIGNAGFGATLFSAGNTSGGPSSLSYNPGAFKLNAITFNFYSYDVSGSGSIPFPDSYVMSLTFKDINGNVIGSQDITLLKAQEQATNVLSVSGVHEIEFSSPNNTARLVSFDISPVPEPATYGMMLAGLGMLGALRRRRKPVR